MATLRSVVAAPPDGFLAAISSPRLERRGSVSWYSDQRCISERIVDQSRHRTTDSPPPLTSAGASRVAPVPRAFSVGSMRVRPRSRCWRGSEQRRTAHSPEPPTLVNRYEKHRGQRHDGEARVSRRSVSKLTDTAPDEGSQGEEKTATEEAPPSRRRAAGPGQLPEPRLRPGPSRPRLPRPLKIEAGTRVRTL
jgi:hypothetical protein